MRREKRALISRLERQRHTPSEMGGKQGSKRVGVMGGRVRENH
jgi:hypothetical protein